MSNIVTFQPALRQRSQDKTERLIAGFAQHRRREEDVFWLKENAELLGILAATQTQVSAASLAPFERFYDQIFERMMFFPQYYRFLLSICLDLEALGLSGDRATGIADWVAAQGLATAELSDLQRAEAFRLLRRAGTDVRDDTDLDARLRTFMRRTETFALPNKKAAYELTHIVFYLSEYGAVDPALDAQARTSLTYAGLLAYLDQNIDLLSEICTALRFAGGSPPAQWDAAVAHAHRSARLSSVPEGGQSDNYHEYLVSGWSMQVAGRCAFEADVPDGGFHVTMGSPQGALRGLSECLFSLGAERSASWRKMRPRVFQALGHEGKAILEVAESSTECFAPFFSHFARA